MTDQIAVVMDKIANPIIIGGGIACLLWMIKLSGNLRALKAETENKLLHVGGGAQINPKTLAMRQRNTAIASREESYDKKDRFMKLCSQYSTLSHLIPVFPLLGILGTVAGLYQQVSSKDASVIYDALDMALSTTLWGLLTAVILKVLEAFLVIRLINDIDAAFDSYDVRYQDATFQKNYSDGSEE